MPMAPHAPYKFLFSPPYCACACILIIIRLYQIPLSSFFAQFLAFAFSPFSWLFTNHPCGYFFRICSPPAFVLPASVVRCIPSFVPEAFGVLLLSVYKYILLDSLSCLSSAVAILYLPACDH